MSRIFTARAVPLMTFAVRADALWLDVTAEDGARTASVELTGPAQVLDGARAELSGSTWTLTVPRDPASGATTGRRVFINGAEVRLGEHGRSPEVLRAVVRLPEGASLAAHVGAGQVSAGGRLAAVMAEAVSADLELTGTTGALDASSVSGDIDIAATGPALVRTTSGDITLAAVYGAVTAHTTSGDIRVHVAAPVTVRADSVSGDIRVTADHDAHPAVTARSVSGRVRTPKAGEAR